jgi:transcriptional regulator with XRE-family HTH domain
VTVLRISSVQSKMARAALGWGIRDLAHVAKVSSDTISRLERGEELKERTLNDIRLSFERAGVEFLAGNGVRLGSATIPAAPSGSGSGGTRKPRSAGKSTAPRKAPERKAAPSSKLGQIRALREQGAE